jgi:hypothetical protein
MGGKTMIGLTECKHEHTSDFSSGPFWGEGDRRIIHKYCNYCGMHWYDGKVYNRKEWDAYVNDPVKEKA